MGTVYRARDIVLDRDVALKVLHTGANLNAELRERFNREARAGAKLQHPSIVIVYDMGEATGASYIAMELLKGADLRSYIHEARPLSLAQKLEFLAQICDGLAHAHRHGIVHRDIKPSNIFIQEEKQAKLLDFSIARLPSSKLTIVGRVLGSPNYMAPEQVLSRPCDTRSDLFSAAIVFFEFLVNSHPFASAFIPRRIVEGDPDSLCERDPLIPESLDHVIAAGLKRNPDERLQSAEEFAIRLRAVAQELRTGLAAPMSFDGSARASDPLPGQFQAGSAAVSEDDSAQWRVSEFIRMLREFDDALALGRVDVAQAKMDQMRKMMAVDGRFSDAILEYQRRLDAALAGSEQAQPLVAAAGAGSAVEYEQRLPAASSTTTFDDLDVTQRFFGTKVEPSISSPPDRPSETDAGATPEPVVSPPGDSEVKACRSCGSGNRVSARFCKDCGEDLSLPVVSGAAPSDEPKPPPRVSQDFLSRLTQAQRLIGVAVVVAVLIAAALITRSLTGAVPIEKSVGVAVVEAPATYIMERQFDSGKRLMTLQRGMRVNVLEPLKARDQPFVHAQYVSNSKNSRPGYVRTRDLGQWDSNDATNAWSLVVIFAPPDGAPEDQQRKFIEELRKFASRFPGTPQAAEANLQRARLHLEIARRRKSAGAAGPEWQAEVTHAREAIDGAGSDPPGATEVARLRQELEGLTAPEPETGQQQTDPQALARQKVLQELNQKAQALYYAADLDGVLEQAKKMLAIDPSNEPAQWWHQKVRELKSLK